MGRKTQNGRTRVRDYFIEEARMEYEGSDKSKRAWCRYVAKADFARRHVTI